MVIIWTNVVDFLTHYFENDSFHKCVLFHTDLTMKSAGLGCATFDREGLRMNFTINITSHQH